MEDFFPLLDCDGDAQVLGEERGDPSLKSELDSAAVLSFLSSSFHIFIISKTLAGWFVSRSWPYTEVTEYC